MTSGQQPGPGDLVGQYRWPSQAPLASRPSLVAENHQGAAERFALVRLTESTIRKLVDAGGPAWTVLLLLAMRAPGLTGKDGKVTIPAQVYKCVGLSRYQYSRGLERLAEAGLIELDAQRGRSLRARITVDVGVRRKSTESRQRSPSLPEDD